MKLSLGAGDTKIDGFISVDLYDEAADVKADICDLPYADGEIEEAVAFQVIEHVPYQKSQDMFREIYRVLKPGGQLIIETPDIDAICRMILGEEGLSDFMIYNLVGEYYRPWDHARYADWDNCAAAIHRNPWNYERLCRIAGGVGFQVERVDDMDQKVSKFEENLRCRLLKPA